jgi:hypothetical protein
LSFETAFAAVLSSSTRSSKQAKTLILQLLLQLLFHSFHVSPFVFCVIHPCKTERREGGGGGGEEEEEEENNKRNGMHIPPCPRLSRYTQNNFMMLTSCCPRKLCAKRNYDIVGKVPRTSGFS